MVGVLQRLVQESSVNTSTIVFQMFSEDCDFKRVTYLANAKATRAQTTTAASRMFHGSLIYAPGWKTIPKSIICNDKNLHNICDKDRN